MGFDDGGGQLVDQTDDTGELPVFEQRHFVLLDDLDGPLLIPGQ
ncbi:hypothetical protein AB0L63_18910 [Nocardia sp. NPDC051990]